MPEDAPGNPGAVRSDGRPAGQAVVSRKVREMQAKLHRWAGEDRSRRFGDLFNLVCDLDFLAEGWLRVRASAGSRTPGIDKATVAGIENRIGAGAFPGQIRDSLKSGEFRPEPVRQVMIPKKSGKLRKPGIPTVAGRWSRLPSSSCSNPSLRRTSSRAHTGSARAAARTTRSPRSSCSPPRDTPGWRRPTSGPASMKSGMPPLMDRLRARIKDKRVLALVRAFLKAGVMTADGGREETYTGTPQGGILSPLLASIALSAPDEHFTRHWQEQMGTRWQREKRRRKGLGTWRLVRYADDWVVMVNGTRAHAEALREQAADVLAPLGLRLADEKTRVVHIDEGFDFLSFTIRRMRKRGTAKHYVYTVPSRKAIQAVKDKISARTYRSTRHMDPAVLIQSINPTLAGRANYFRHGVSRAVFSAADARAWGRIMRWLRHKYSHPGMPEMRRRFCVRGTWQFAANGVRFTGASAVPVTRYRYRGSIPTPWAPQPVPAPG
jgi:RNA-directed DNA polymerase